jgi:D-glycero-D-manno-heptose 1,7-bisphosphate phosphatase
MSRPAVFLDRDGVLNRSFDADGVPVPPDSASRFELLPGVIDACNAFARAGLALVVVTNQPDIARGTLSPAELEQMHLVLRRELPVDDVVVCPHDDGDDCPCRKPRPGMLLDAAARLNLDLSRSVLVGDRWRDVEAARRAGVASVWIDRGLAERAPDSPGARFGSLAEARHHVLRVCGAEGLPDPGDGRR